MRTHRARSGGNYWNDYDGVDLFSGPYQNEPGSDGIGDTPYLVVPYPDWVEPGANIMDHYQLMDPWSPNYELTVSSVPVTQISFTINEVPHVTPYTDMLPEGSYVLEMPETHNGYVWSHWLEGGDTNRVKTITLPGTTWTGVYVSAPVPVGGEWVPINKSELLAPWIGLASVITLATVSIIYVKRKKKQQS